MPAKLSIDAHGPVAAQCAALGASLRARRLQLGVSMAAAAAAAGMSRLTWSRLEGGSAAVTLGAVAAAASALGLEIGVGLNAAQAPSVEPGPSFEAIRPADYPQLASLAWQLGPDATLTPQEALNLYERNWRHVDANQLEARERELIHDLVARVGGGVLHV